MFPVGGNGRFHRRIGPECLTGIVDIDFIIFLECENELGRIIQGIFKEFDSFLIGAIGFTVRINIMLRSDTVWIPVIIGVHSISWGSDSGIWPEGLVFNAEV